jgi:hypothetical protein
MDVDIAFGVHVAEKFAERGEDFLDVLGLLGLRVCLIDRAIACGWTRPAAEVAVNGMDAAKRTFVLSGSCPSIPNFGASMSGAGGPLGSDCGHARSLSQ